ncbi:MAG: M48 family metallopeptidase [Terriglobia bacterium]
MRHRMGRLSLFVAVLAFAASLYAEEPEVSKPLYNTFSDEEEMAMGRSSAEEIEKTQPLLSDATLQAYVEKVGQRVAQASRRKELQYHFRVVNNPSVNAFSLPGGYVYVDRGLLDFVETESELAGVLAHEVGHVVAYHSMNDVARRWLVDRVMYEGQKAGLLNDQQIHDVLKQYGGPALLFVDRKFSREEENEADLLGIYNEARAGWDPAGLVAFLRRLIRMGANQDLFELLMRRHPLPEDRVDALGVELKQIPAVAGWKKNSAAFHAMKDRLGTLPPSPPPVKAPS